MKPIKLPENSRKYMLWAGLFLALVAMVFLFTDETKKYVRKADPLVRNILIDNNSNEYGLETLNSRVVTITNEQSQMNLTLDRIDKRLSNPDKSWERQILSLKNIMQSENKKVRDLTGDLYRLTKELEGVKARELNKADSESVETEDDGDTSNDQNNTPDVDNKKANKQPDELSSEILFSKKEDIKSLADAYKDQPTGLNSGIRTTGRETLQNNKGRATINKNNTRGGNGKPGAAGRQNVPIKHVRSMRVISQEPTEEEIKAKEDQKIKIEKTKEAKALQDVEPEVEIPSIRIPAGSIFSGVLIAGMDAPTHENARKDPHPALLRISKETLLPNKYTADFEECFVLLSGYGDISSERAYLRAESISCIREDGGTVEASINAYTLGEDGKAGIRGRMVSKQGQVIVRSMMAGFAEGVSEAFSGDTNIFAGASGSQYASILNPDTAQQAVGKGASNAMGKIAEYYLKLADNLFPIIEISPGREIDMILTKGIDLKYIPSDF